MNLVIYLESMIEDAKREDERKGWEGMRLKKNDDKERIRDLNRS